MLPTFCSTSSWDNPSPFSSAGRVATFQNSAMFCEQKEDGFFLPDQLRDGASGLRAEKVIWFGSAQLNIRVNKDIHQWSRPSYIPSRLMALSERGGVGRWQTTPQKRRLVLRLTGFSVLP